jgi:PRC-barrel domain
MDRPRPWLRLIDAKNLDTDPLAFDGLDVSGVDGEKLGKVEGFIIDIGTGRPYHVVVGSGTWFSHKHFLLPVGHASLGRSAAGDTTLTADLTRDHVKHFPGFDLEKFEKLSNDELKMMEESMVAACCPGELLDVESGWGTRSHYDCPTWWDEGYYRPARPPRDEQAGVTIRNARDSAADEER